MPSFRRYWWYCIVSLKHVGLEAHDLYYLCSNPYTHDILSSWNYSETHFFFPFFQDRSMLKLLGKGGWAMGDWGEFEPWSLRIIDFLLITLGIPYRLWLDQIDSFLNLCMCNSLEASKSCPLCQLELLYYVWIVWGSVGKKKCMKE